MLAQLGAVGAGPPPMGGGFDQGPPPPDDPAGGAGQASDLLRQILDLADEYRQQEQSDQNIALVEQLRTIAAKILANEEKEKDDMLGGKINPAAIRRYASG